MILLVGGCLRCSKRSKHSNVMDAPVLVSGVWYRLTTHPTVYNLPVTPHALGSSHVTRVSRIHQAPLNVPSTCMV